MKRLLTLLLALMLAVPALADAAYSPELLALKTALAALREEYGFTMTTAGVFHPEVTLTEGGAQVIFRPHTCMPVDRLGEYTAVITDDDVALTWSHADQASTLTTEADCPIWGHAQVQTYFDHSISGKDAWVENYISPEQERTEAPEVRDGLDYTWIPLAKQAIPSDALREIGKAALADIYAMTPAELAEFYIEVEPGLISCTDGAQYWFLRSGDPNNFFTLLIDKATNQVLRMTHYAGGLG